MVNERTALYRTFGAADELLYIGVSNDFGRRWTQHAHAQPWWPLTQRQTIDWYGSRKAAEAAEDAAIKAEHPRFNDRLNGRRGGRTTALTVRFSRDQVFENDDLMMTLRRQLDCGRLGKAEVIHALLRLARQHMAVQQALLGELRGASQ